MKKIFFVLVFSFILHLYGEVEIFYKGNQIEVKNSNISIFIEKKSGIIKEIKKNENSIKCGSGLFSYYFYPLPPDEYGGDNRGRPVMQKTNMVEIGKEWKTESGLFLPFKWKNEYGSIEKIIFVPEEGEFFNIRFKISLEKEPSEISFGAEKIDGFNLPQLVFYPEREKFGWRKYNLVPCYTVAYDNSKKFGLGIIVGENGDIDRISKQILYQENNPLSLRMDIWVKKIEREVKNYEGEFTVFLISEMNNFLKIWEKANPESFKKRKILQIVKVFPDKLIYKNNEEGKVSVSIVNNSSTSQTATLICTITKRINEKEKEEQKKIELEPMGFKTLTFSFNTGNEDYGREVSVKILIDGKLVDEKKEYFTVGTNWVKYYDYCIMYPSKSYDENGIPWEIYNLRENYITATHLFAWYPIIGDLDPKEDEYMSQQGILKNKNDILRFVKGCEKFGIKKEAYYAIWVTSIPGTLNYASDPTKIVFNQYGQPFTETARIAPGKNITIPSINLYTEYFRNYLAKEIIESVDMFGWNSVFYDCIMNLGQAEPRWNSVYHHYTYDGKMIGKLFAPTVKEAVKKWINEIREKVKTKYPEFVFTANFVGPIARQITESKENEELFLTYFNCVDAVMSELGGGGDVLAKKAGVGILEELKDHFDYIGRWISEKGEKRRKLFPYGPFNYAGEVGTKSYLSLAFANNFHVGSWWPAPSYSYFGRPLMEYYKFRLRYSAYLYDDDIKWLPPEKINFIEVETPEKVFWKEYVYEKNNEKGKDLLIHFVNMPQAKYCWRENAPPIKRENIKVKVIFPAGYECSKIYLISPDNGSEVEEIKFEKTGKKIEFTIPSLYYYDLIIIEMSKI